MGKEMLSDSVRSCECDICFLPPASKSPINGRCLPHACSAPLLLCSMPCDVQPTCYPAALSSLPAVCPSLLAHGSLPLHSALGGFSFLVSLPFTVSKAPCTPAALLFMLTNRGLVSGLTPPDDFSVCPSNLPHLLPLLLKFPLWWDLWHWQRQKYSQMGKEKTQVLPHSLLYGIRGGEKMVAVTSLLQHRNPALEVQASALFSSKCDGVDKGEQFSPPCMNGIGKNPCALCLIAWENPEVAAHLSPLSSSS